ncbi:hypothetical protein IMG5_187150 [Ichthyophthirius multifiliis]|uniref:P-loop containing nucleoside triphosphate hydrolase n=1 Tax=Ichthyophthirius multifiliis TaxID=5932 RepID=G0R3T9_ICHMU|nr:hypothetical protein IMG5_187150 [Ichthyophthirius multifiliis]EGR27871.1 hypothetical protein IMG5_187150 [Ichthyophthirius multifiliis]|eukprot:XP_004027216.1 hypothetical protein IMG5_187150 [Ichthyophthirius multifiliis]
MGLKFKDVMKFCNKIKEEEMKSRKENPKIQGLQIKYEDLQDAIYKLALRNKYIRENGKQRLLQDFQMCLQILRRQFPLIILLGGTSGTGKSTVSSILASRFQIPTCISTDSIRHIMRNFMDEKQLQILFASTYEAGSFVQDQTVKEQKKVIQGYKQQCKLVQEKLDQPLVIEGVHLTPGFMLNMMKKYPFVIPFSICIIKEFKHKQRFAVRSKYMTLDKKLTRQIQKIKKNKSKKKKYDEISNNVTIHTSQHGNVETENQSEGDSLILDDENYSFNKLEEQQLEEEEQVEEDKENNSIDDDEDENESPQQDLSSEDEEQEEKSDYEEVSDGDDYQYQSLEQQVQQRKIILQSKSQYQLNFDEEEKKAKIKGRNMFKRKITKKLENNNLKIRSISANQDNIYK